MKKNSVLHDFHFMNKKFIWKSSKVNLEKAQSYTGEYVVEWMNFYEMKS